MKALKEKGYKMGPNTFEFACKYGNMTNMKWLIENGCEFTGSFIMHYVPALYDKKIHLNTYDEHKEHECTIHDFIDIIQNNEYINKEKHRVQDDILWAIFRLDTISGAKRFLSDWRISRGSDDMQTPDIYASLEMLAYVHSIGLKYARHAFGASFASGNLDHIQYIIDKGYTVMDNFYEYACESSNMTTLLWLNKNFRRAGYIIYEYAIYTGSLDYMNCLFKHGFRLFKELFDIAVKRGNVPIARWLLANKCDFNVHRDDIDNVSNEMHEFIVETIPLSSTIYVEW